MKQRYDIFKNETDNQLTIKEYAELDKVTYSLLCEQKFDMDALKKAMEKGKDALVSAIRTENMYPPARFAEKIAESVTELVKSVDKESIEIYFDDAVFLSREKEAEEAEESKEDEEVEETEAESGDIDELLDDSIEDEFEDDDKISNLNSSLRVADDDSLDIEDEGGG